MSVLNRMAPIFAAIVLVALGMPMVSPSAGAAFAKGWAVFGPALTFGFLQVGSFIVAGLAVVAMFVGVYLAIWLVRGIFQYNPEIDDSAESWKTKRWWNAVVLAVWMLCCMAALKENAYLAYMGREPFLRLPDGGALMGWLNLMAAIVLPPILGLWFLPFVYKGICALGEFVESE